MIPQTELDQQNEKLKSFIDSALNSIKGRLAELKKTKILRNDFTSIRNELKETEKLSKGVKEADFPFLKEELDHIKVLSDELQENAFTLLDDWDENKDSVKKETERLLFLLRKDMATLKEIVGRLGMKSFLKEEIEEISSSLNDLKGKIKDADLSSLQAERDERRESLASADVLDDSELFILRRETGMLKENVGALAVKRKWWSGIPISAWLALLALVIIAYFTWLAIIQWRGGNQGLIYDYPATQTATALQAEAIKSATMTPSAAPTPTP
jgi:hypothetical protein